MIGNAKVAATRQPAAPMKTPDRLASLNAPRTFFDLSSLLLSVPGGDGAELAAGAYDSDEDTRAFFRVVHPAHRPAGSAQQPAAPVLPQARWRIPDHSHLPPLPAFEDLLTLHGLKIADKGAVRTGLPRMAAVTNDNECLWPFDSDDEARSLGTPENEIDTLDSTHHTGHARKSSIEDTSQQHKPAPEECISSTPLAKDKVRLSDLEDTLELLRSPSLPNMMELTDMVNSSLSGPSPSFCQPPDRHPRRVAPSVPVVVESLVTSRPQDSQKYLPSIDASVTKRTEAATAMNDADFEAFIRRNNQRVQQERIESRRTRTVLLREPVNSRSRQARPLADDISPLKMPNILVRSCSHSASQYGTCPPTEDRGDPKLEQTSHSPSADVDPSPLHLERQLESRNHLQQSYHHGQRRTRIRAYVQYTSAESSSRKVASNSHQARKHIGNEPSEISSGSSNSGPEMKSARGIQGRRARSALGPVVPNVTVTNRTRLNQASSLHKEQLRQQATDRRNEQDLAELLNRHNSQVLSQRRIVGRFPP